jgi:hypothetical protein
MLQSKMYPPKFLKYFESFCDEDELSDFKNTIAEILNENDLDYDSLDSESRFGLIVYCKNNTENFVLKCFPKVNKKIAGEFEFIKSGNFSQMIPVLKVDYGSKYYIMSKGEQTYEFSLKRKVEVICEILKKSFEDVRSSKQEVCAQTYKEKIMSIKKRMLPYSIKYELLFDLLVESERLYINVFDNSPNYYIHGDLHFKNVVMFEGEYKVIDPIGIIAPMVFECTKFIENEIFLCYSYEDFLLNYLQIIKGLTEISIDLSNLHIALLIDSILRTCSSCLYGDSLEIVNQGILNAKFILRYISEVNENADFIRWWR